MRIYITVDGGTTNTRLRLVKDHAIVDTVRLDVGARAGMENRDLLKSSISRAVNTLLARNALAESDVTRVLASGMITSEFGLCNLPHLLLPAGIAQLHDGLHETLLEDECGIPFVFVRGVKTAADGFETADMMRGEETELMGIVDAAYGECVYVLPGSHSKIIRTDAQGRICDFSTMLTGEMIAALSQNTILKDAVDLDVSEADGEYLRKGSEMCKAQGLNKTLFKTRVLKNLYGCSRRQTYSFFLGAVLWGEIGQILSCDAPTVVLGGRSQIRNAMALLLQQSGKRVIVLDDETVERSTALGAVRIYEYGEER